MSSDNNFYILFLKENEKVFQVFFSLGPYMILFREKVLDESWDGIFKHDLTKEWR